MYVIHFYLLWFADEIGLGYEHYLCCSQRHLAPHFWSLLLSAGYVSRLGPDLNEVEDDGDEVLHQALLKMLHVFLSEIKVC